MAAALHYVRYKILVCHVPFCSEHAVSCHVVQGVLHNILPLYTLLLCTLLPHLLAVQSGMQFNITCPQPATGGWGALAATAGGTTFTIGVTADPACTTPVTKLTTYTIVTKQAAVQLAGPSSVTGELQQGSVAALVCLYCHGWYTYSTLAELCH
jgi:hypothetical protein